MGHHHNRPPGTVEGIEQVHNVVAGGGVEIAGRLVGQNHMRVVDQSSRDRHPLLLSSRKLRGPVAEPAREADQLRQLEAALAAAGQRRPLVGERHLDILHHAQLLNEIVRLKNKAQIPAADARERLVVHRRHILTGEEILPRGGPIETAEHIEQRAFS